MAVPSKVLKNRIFWCYMGKAQTIVSIISLEIGGKTKE